MLQVILVGMLWFLCYSCMNRIVNVDKNSLLCTKIADTLSPTNWKVSSNNSHGHYYLVYRNL